MKSKILLVLAILFFIPYSLFADILVIEGKEVQCYILKATPQGFNYYYRGEDGSLLYYETEWTKIERWGSDRGREGWWKFADKYLKLEIKEDSIEWYNLALWCKENELKKEYLWLLKQVAIGDKSRYLSNDDVGMKKARGDLEKLGYRWAPDFHDYMTEFEEMTKRGYRRYKERWLAEDEIALMKEKEVKLKEEKEREDTFTTDEIQTYYDIQGLLEKRARILSNLNLKGIKVETEEKFLERIRIFSRIDIKRYKMLCQKLKGRSREREQKIQQHSRSSSGAPRQREVFHIGIGAKDDWSFK